jgi:DNA-binding NarL/FixJ family response regulator
MTQVVLFDPQPVVLEGLSNALVPPEDIVIANCATTLNEATTLIVEHKPDVVVMDNEPSAIEHILSLPEPPTILIFSTAGDASAIQNGFQCGAQGYVLRCEDTSFVSSAIRSITEGHRYVSPEVQRRLADSALNPNNDTAPAVGIDGLTAREQEVLRLLAQGKPNKEIATALTISENTVRHHLKNIYAKLQLTTRGQAIAWAMQDQLT